MERLNKILSAIQKEADYQNYLGIPDPLVCSYYDEVFSAIRFLKLYDILAVSRENDSLYVNLVDGGSFRINPSEFQLKFLLGLPEIYKDSERFNEILRIYSRTNSIPISDQILCRHGVLEIYNDVPFVCAYHPYGLEDCPDFEA